MRDYMRALQERFYTAPDSKFKTEAQELRRELADRLGKQERKLLLRLTDVMDRMTGEISLASFTAGFRLAAGLARELSLEEPYSFGREEELRAITACTASKFAPHKTKEAPSSGQRR